jgi:hypothetical protein
MEFQHIGEPTATKTTNRTDFMEKVLRDDPHRTIVIAGLPRGGTTMVAAAVEALGVYLGPENDLRNFHFEDQRMNSPHLDEQHVAIKENDSKHQVWGWKDPGAIHPLRELSWALRNPMVIIVFRDLFTSIQGEMRFDEEHGYNRSLADLIDSTINNTQRNWEFVKRTQLPTLLVCYERAVQNREAFVKQLVDFMQIEPSDSQIRQAVDRISPEGGYMVW